jgi:hypothetical protein
MVAALGGLSIVAAQAQDEEDLSMDFLEYLGSWQETDEEWLIVSEWEADRAPPADDHPETEAESNEDE